MDDFVFGRVYSIVSNTALDILESDVLDFLKIENRWPYQYYHDIDFSSTTHYQRPESYCPIQCIGYNDIHILDQFYDRRGRFIFDIWKKYYDLGFTTMISDVLDLNESLRSLRQKIFNETGLRINGNFYLTGETTNQNCVSWNHHNHNYDVIVKSIYGKSLWKINDEIVELEKNPIGILSGTYHSVISCPTKRLTLTINL